MNYTLELTKFLTTDNLPLPALYYKPTQPTSTAAIFLHGNGNTSALTSVDKSNIWGEMFTQIGIAYFPFNNRGAQLLNKLKWYENEVKKEYYCGSARELIKDCILDIDGAIDYLSALGYTKFILVGDSTGANKACVYNYYKQDNRITKFILLEGGDDTGIYYDMIGKEKFKSVLEMCQNEIQKGNGLTLVSQDIIPLTLSYQSLYDVLNPDGDYNIFPYNEMMHQLNLSKKELFCEYRSIIKPTLVVYGENDEYCYGNVTGCIDILKKESSDNQKFTFKIIPNAPHGFSDYEKEVAQVISSWLLST